MYIYLYLTQLYTHIVYHYTVNCDAVQKRETFSNIASSFVSPELEWHVSYSDIAGVAKRQAGFGPNSPAHILIL